jgi:CRP/FNR family cyclic AMP-dependent transcriptional regulator
MSSSPVLDLNQLNKIAVFNGLATDDLKKMASLLRGKTLPAGTMIMSVQQEGEVVYVILDGTVKIHIEQADGTDVIIGILGAGDILGEMSLLDNEGRSANAVTLEESSLLWMDRRAFRECLQSMPGLSFNLARVLAARLRLADEQIQALATLEVESRVARQILAFADKYGVTDAGGDVVIPIRLTQSDLGSMVGASRERINKILVSYKKRGYLSISNTYRISIHNREVLAKRCR